MKNIVTIAVAILMPVAVFAQERITNVYSLFDRLADFGDMAVWLLISLAIVFIVWNSVQFIIHASDEAGRAQYRSAIIWGIVGLFVILSIWGLVNILMNTFGTGSGGNNLESSRDLNSLILK